MNFGEYSCRYTNPTYPLIPKELIKLREKLSQLNLENNDEKDFNRGHDYFDSDCQSRRL